jgi:opacity protein-like surface antigen
MKLAKLLCGVALGGLLASNAFAADLLYSQPAPQAVAYGGPYFGAKIGANWADDYSTLVDGGGAADTFDFDTGFTGSIVAGYAFGGRWGMLSPRLEVEAGYLQADVDTLSLNGGAGTPNTGDVDAFYWFTNLLLDIPMSGWGFTPFIGGGIGFAQVDFNNLNLPAAPGTVTFNDSDTTFAWNLTAGLAYDISRNVTFDVAYRFVQFSDVNITNTTGTVNTSDDLSNHQVTAGVRVHL